MIEIDDVLGRRFVFEDVDIVFEPDGALAVRYRPGHPQAGGLAARFAAGGWVAALEPGDHIKEA